jgi:hypothetical protein
MKMLKAAKRQFIGDVRRLKYLLESQTEKEIQTYE